ncbi:MAG: hypothetical protein K6T91_02005, partial [Firmicutes bacterium]|nr:hypothetical protein [Bacillota bacterium]
TGASTNIKADYDSDSPYAGHQTSSEGTQTIGWKPPPSGKKYNAHMKIPCMVCHDSHGSSKGNYKMLADGLYAYATSPTGGNWADPNENGKIDPGAEACLVCHPKSTETNRNSIIAGIKMPYLPVGGSVNHDTVTGCDCHNTHNPQPPNATESVGGTACESCHANILNSMQSSSGYHHYVITAEAVYPTESPAGNNYMLQPGTRSCLMCHVDHDMFRPDLNSNGNRARNLRAEIQTAPSKNDINSYMATDFDNNAMRGGICLSCHAAASFTKDTNGQTGGSTTTQLLNKNDYNASAHNYQASSTFTKDTSAFKGNCVKCHNDTTNKLYQSTTPKFANHNSNFKSLLTDNGTAGGGTGIPTAEAADIDNSGLEENFCYLCHSGTGAGGNDIYGQLMSGKAKNIKDQFAKAYRHPVETPGKHTSDEFEKAAPGWMPANNRHAECEDCHNPHAAKAGDRAVGDPANGNKAGPAIAGIWGVSVTDWATGAFAKTPSVTFEYELCLKCHSSYAWGTGPAPATTWPNGAAGATQADPVQDFNPGNLGYHPVAATGKTAPTGGGATKLPLTFIAPYAWNSLITCSDCHGDDGWISNGSVASGPHGSNSRYMLRRYYNSAQGVWTSNFCYECHDYKVYGFQQLGPNIDIYSAPMDPYKSYSRVDHPLTSKMANGSLNMFRLNQDESSGPMCFNCHGAYGGTIQNMRLGGIHGSNQGVGTYGTSPIGQRLMNGSNVIGYTAPSTTLSGSCWTSGTASNPSLSDCTQHSSGVSISNSNWDY